MAKKTYAELLKDPRWQKKRLEIMSRDNWKCKLCGDEKTTLQVHHKEYISGNDPWDYPNDMLVTLCEHCHDEISEEEYKDVPFNKLRILNLNKWTSGSRIVFITAMNGPCLMRLYDENDTFVCGYELEHCVPDIIKILKLSQRK